MLLRWKSLTYLGLAFFSFSAGFFVTGFQGEWHGAHSMSHYQSSLSTGLNCPNGLSLSETSYHLENTDAATLLALGNKARVTLKKCLCDNFAGSACAALQAEIQDVTQNI